VTKNWGEKSAKQFFPETRIVRTKNAGKKIVRKKCNKRFLHSHEYREQKMRGKKRAKQFFQKTRIVRAKMLERNRRKKCKKSFLYSHEYRDQKMRGKALETIFPETHK